MIKITGPMLIIFLTAVFLFLAATNIQVGWVYLVDALLWSVIAGAVILPLLQLRKLRLKRHFPPVAFTGQSLTVEVELENPGRWPLAFVNLEDLPPVSLRGGPVKLDDIQKGFVVALGQNQSYRYSYSFTPEHDGVYIFNSLRSGSFGPLGLLGVYWDQKVTSAVVVRPLPPETVMPLMSDEQQLALMHARQRSHLGEDISHFREYQPGDNRRSIHWKNTAKRQRLIVAEAREEPFQQALLLVDTDKNQNPQTYHRLVRQAERVCHALLENQMELVCFAQNAEPAFWSKLDLSPPERSLQNVRSWDMASYWLATLEPDAGESLEAALVNQGVSPGEQLVVLISANPSPELLYRLCTGRAAAGLAPMLVFAPSGTQIPQELTPLISLREL